MTKIASEEAAVAPNSEAERRALSFFIEAVKHHYGDRLVEIVLFGSRARGDARPDSDADIAVVLKDGDWPFWGETRVLAELAYDPLIESGLAIQPWPVAESSWVDPSKHDNRLFAEAIRRDGRKLAA